MRVIGCARCGADHEDITPQKLDRPIAPPETSIMWSHWAPCPTNGQPIIIAMTADDMLTEVLAPNGAEA